MIDFPNVSFFILFLTPHKAFYAYPGRNKKAHPVKPSGIRPEVPELDEKLRPAAQSNNTLHLQTKRKANAAHVCFPLSKNVRRG